MQIDIRTNVLFLILSNKPSRSAHNTQHTGHAHTHTHVRGSLGRAEQTAQCNHTKGWLSQERSEPGSDGLLNQTGGVWRARPPSRPPPSPTLCSTLLWSEPIQDTCVCLMEVPILHSPSACSTHSISVSLSCRCQLVKRARVCVRVCVGVWERVCTCVCVCVCACRHVCFPSPSQYLERSVAWAHRRGTMSELEQLRQEAEQLRNQIRVWATFCVHVFVYVDVCVCCTCVCTSHVCHCLFTASCDSHSFKWDSDALDI